MVVFHSNNEVFVAILVGMVGWSGTYILDSWWWWVQGAITCGANMVQLKEQKENVESN